MSKKEPWLDNPVADVRWVPVENVRPNEYNPNSVAPNEMRLLHTSISHDGYTQPVVVIEDHEKPGHYIIVDGFHRYTIMRTHDDIRTKNKGMLPVVVIEKDINDRMASTIRHNRARGKHSIDGMADMVFSMLDEGWSDADICNEIGCSPEELVRLKHTTGFSKLAEGWDWSNSWATARMNKFRREYEEKKNAESAAAKED